MSTAVVYIGKYGIGDFVFSTPLLSQLPDPVLYFAPEYDWYEQVSEISLWPTVKGLPWDQIRKADAVYAPLSRPEVPGLKFHWVDGNLWREGHHDCELHLRLLPGAERAKTCVKYKPTDPFRGNAGLKIAIANSASYLPKWQRKKWPIGYMNEFIDIMTHRYDSHCVLLGGPAENSPHYHPELTSLAGKLSIAESAGVCMAADVVLATETGLMHIADAAGANIVALYGISPHSRCYPWNGNAKVIRSNGGGCEHFSCFHGPTHDVCQRAICMESISVEEVLDAVLDAAPARGETSKARARRKADGFFAKYADGKDVLDVGSQFDPLLPYGDRYDRHHGHGDAQYLEEIADESYDTVYASHILEHIVDPDVAIRNWLRVCRPGGHLIISIPHRDLYEKSTELPSKWNPDHKHYFLPDKDEAPCTLSLKRLGEGVADIAEIVTLDVRNDGFHSDGPGIHSTGEFSIEMILRKRSAPTPDKPKRKRPPAKKKAQ